MTSTLDNVNVSMSFLEQHVTCVVSAILISQHAEHVTATFLALGQISVTRRDCVIVRIPGSVFVR